MYILDNVLIAYSKIKQIVGYIINIRIPLTADFRPYYWEFILFFISLRVIYAIMMYVAKDKKRVGTKKL